MLLNLFSHYMWPRRHRGEQLRFCSRRLRRPSDPDVINFVGHSCLRQTGWRLLRGYYWRGWWLGDAPRGYLLLTILDYLGAFQERLFWVLVCEPQDGGQVYEECKQDGTRHHQQQFGIDPPCDAAQHEQGDACNDAGLPDHAVREPNVAEGLRLGK